MVIAIRKRYGRTLVRQTTYNPTAKWMRHGTERDVGNRTLATLDVVAHVRPSYSGPGYIVRKAVSK